MVSQTYIGYIQTIMNYQWLYFIDLASNYASWTSSSSTTVYIGQSIFLSYAGAGFAFLLSIVGALDNSGKTLYYVEDSIDDFIRQYGSGEFEEILRRASENEQLQNLLNQFSIDLIMYTTASFLHSTVLISAGTFAGFWILYKLQGLQTTYSDNWFNIPLEFGYKYMLFGVLVGSVDYFAGNVA